MARTPPTFGVLPGMELLDQKTLARVGRLEFLARGRVAGAVSGRHRSPFRGFSAEFAEHREYVPGDDPRNLDWKVFARLDRYYIKRYMDETNLRAYLLLDVSGSMTYTGNQAAKRDGARLSKFDYGRRLAAAIAWLFIHQQDAVGLATFDSAIRRFVPPRARPAHLRVLLETLHNSRPGAETALAPVLHEIAERAARRSMILLISDLFDDPDALVRALHHFRYRKHEVVLFHVIAEEERTFPFEDWSLFEDLEAPGERLPVDPMSLRTAYREEVERFLHRLERECGRLRIEYVPMTSRTDFDLALAAYLIRRKSLVK